MIRLLGFIFFSLMSGTIHAVEFNPAAFNSCLRLNIEKSDGNKYICSSVALDRYTILTAAHCLDQVDAVWVKLDFPLAPIPADSSAIHRLYDRSISNYLNDLALIFLLTPLPSDLKLYPIYRGSADQNANSLLYRCGFGLRNGVNERTIVSPMKIIYEDQDYLELEDLFSFAGDSGGPIYLHENNQFWILGIHSTREFQRSFNPKIPKTN